MKPSITIKLITFLILLINLSQQQNVQVEEEEDFIPTNEWKIVKKGQKIPQGLHVRINFETGITEAKLMDLNEKNDGNSAIQEVKNNQDGNSQEKTKENTNYRSYEEIKEAFEALNLKPTTDAELLKQLIDKHKKIYKAKELDEEHIVVILEDIEYLVHQYDNAQDFIKLKGFPEIIYKNLNSSHGMIKSNALKILGASLQNNVKIQIHALETGALNFLLKILALESDVNIKSRALFSLGALLRRFPLAQLKFIENAGLPVLSKLFESNNVKLQTKLMTLTYDLMLEHIEALKDWSNVDYQEKIKQYKKVDFKTHIIENNFCKYIGDLLVNVVAIDAKDFDTVEKCLKTIELVVDDCKFENQGNINESLLKLLAEFQRLSDEEKSNGDKSVENRELDEKYYYENSVEKQDYFSNLHFLVIEIIKRLNNIRHVNLSGGGKTEL